MLDARPVASHGQNPERRQSTAQQRRNWGPPCEPGAYTRVGLHGGAQVTVDKRIVPAVAALSAVLAKHGYKATPPDCGAYVCRPITGGTGYSLHAYGIAIDINWQDNPYGKRLVTDMPRRMVDDILAITTNSGARVWEWGGDWSGNKDAMHFEIDCTPADLATGLRPEGDDMPLSDADLKKIADLIDRRVDPVEGKVDRVLSDAANQTGRLEGLKVRLDNLAKGK